MKLGKSSSETLQLLRTAYEDAVLSSSQRNMECESLIWSGALTVLNNDLSKLDFDVVALQETPLESGIQKFDNFKFFNSGSESKKT